MTLRTPCTAKENVMKRTWIAVIALGGLLIVPAVAHAHKGHDHTVMGTISSIEGTHVMVKATDGKTTMVMLDGKTKITRGKAAAAASELKVGDRIVASGPEEKEMITAQTVQIGAAPAPKAATKTSGTKAPPK
jgi:hypothetical protein